MANEKERRFPGPLRGQTLFAGAFLVASAILLSQIDSQTIWAKGAKWAGQPRLWPAIALVGMVLFGALHWYQLPRRKMVPDDKSEGWKWLSAFECVGWFLVYVWFVPIIGYLPVTVAFTVALAWRLGYRTAKFYWTAAAFGAAVQ